MTYAEFLGRVEEIAEEYEDDFEFVGIRFENKERVEGEVITDCSRSNPDREDEREFPEYGSEEYEELEELDGVCAYNANDRRGWGHMPEIANDWDVEGIYEQSHCYIIGGNKGDFGEDVNEIIISDATVLRVLF